MRLLGLDLGSNVVISWLGYGNGISSTIISSYLTYMKIIHYIIALNQFIFIVFNYVFSRAAIAHSI
jgi:hypothetical protein